jgi:hypothetical protein
MARSGSGSKLQIFLSHQQQASLGLGGSRRSRLFSIQDLWPPAVPMNAVDPCDHLTASGY